VSASDAEFGVGAPILVDECGAGLKLKQISSPSRRACIVAGLLALVPASRGTAGVEPTQRFPDAVRLTPGGPRLVRRGSGRFRFFFVPYYDCALYTLPALQNAQEVMATDAPRRLVIDALRQITAFEFLWGLDQGLEDNSTRAELKAVERDLERVRASVREAGGLERGMRGALDYVPGLGVRLLINDRPQGPALGGKALADALFKVWLGERPLDGSLKEALIGR